MLLVSNILPYHFLIPTHCRYEVSSRPKMLPDKIAFSLTVYPGYVDRALPLYIPHNLRYGVLRRYRNQHVHMIGHQMALLYPALLLFGQSVKYLTKVTPQLPIQRSAPAFRNKYKMIFT